MGHGIKIVIISNNNNFYPILHSPYLFQYGIKIITIVAVFKS